MMDLRKFSYFLINKPYGTLSQFTREQPAHQVLSDHYNFPKDVYPVGRLDRDSEGLLVLTNDKRLNAAMLHPKNKLSKEYWVQVEGVPSESELQPLRAGVSIKVNKAVHHCLPAQVSRMPEPQLWERTPPVRFRKNSPTSWCKIVITEGKNRQVRKMFAAVGFPVLRLVRWRIAQLDLVGLENGAVKEFDLRVLGLKL